METEAFQACFLQRQPLTEEVLHRWYRFLVPCEAARLHERGSWDPAWAFAKTAVRAQLGAEVDAMVAVARAYKARSLADFQAALDAHKAQLGDDPIVHFHLSALYDTLLEGNLVRCRHLLTP